MDWKLKKLDKMALVDFDYNHKSQRYDALFDLHLRNENDPFLKRIVMCDKRWIMHENRNRSGHWLDKDEPPRWFLKAKITETKIMATVWWSAAGIIHYKFLKIYEMITADN